MKHEEITRSILSCALATSWELGSGCLEAVYENALTLALKRGHSIERQKAFQVRFRNVVVGEYFADLVVEGAVIVGLKATRALAPEHFAQLVNYLRASGMEVGLLLNFGNPKLEFRRLTRSHSQIPQNFT